MYVCACEGTANQIFRTDSRFYHLQSSVGFTGSTSPSTINITPMWQTAPSWYLKLRLKQILVFVHLSINPNTKAHCTLVSQPGTGISKTQRCCGFCVCVFVYWHLKASIGEQRSFFLPSIDSPMSYGSWPLVSFLSLASFFPLCLLIGHFPAT